MFSNCFNKNTPNFEDLSIEFWKREMVNDLFLAIENIVAGTATVSKKIFNEQCLQWKVELPSNSPRIFLQYELKCDAIETVQMMIPLMDYQIVDDNSETVDYKNIDSQEYIVTSVEIENKFSPVCKLKREIPELLSILNDNKKIKDKNVEKDQIASSGITHINSRSTSHSENIVHRSAATLQTDGQNGNCDDIIHNKRKEEIVTNKVIKRKKPNTHSCSNCDKSFKRKSMKQCQERIHTSEKPQRSSKSRQHFSGSCNLNEAKILTRKNSYMFKTCDKSFTDTRTQIDRYRFRTSETAYKCENCGKCFTQAANLRVHQRIHTGEKPFRCEECGKRFTQTSNLASHRRIHTGERPFKCGACGQSFVQSHSLVHHRRIHSGEKPFKCDECDKPFTRAFHLKLHQRLHTGEKPFKCEDCGKCFAQANNLTIHRRTHTGERPFKCEVCCKSFAHSSALVLHTRIHTGEKPFKCEDCGKCFTQANKLTIHKRTHTGERPFECAQCGKSFAHSQTLVVHTRLHSGKKYL